MTSLGIIASGVKNVVPASFSTQGPVVFSADAASSIAPSLPVGWQPTQLAIAVVYNNEGVAGDWETSPLFWSLHSSEYIPTVDTNAVYVHLRRLAVGDVSPTFEFVDGATPTYRHSYITTWSNPGNTGVMADYNTNPDPVTSDTQTDLFVTMAPVLLIQIAAVEYFADCRMLTSNGFTTVATSGTSDGFGSSIVTQKYITEVGLTTAPVYTWGDGSDPSKLTVLNIILTGT